MVPDTVTVMGGYFVNKRWTFCTVVAMLLVLASSDLKADVTFLEELGSGFRLGFSKTRIYAVSNEITPDDARKIESIVQATPQNTQLTFRLDSLGGDLTAAIVAGRAMRKARATAQVYKQCYSACVLVLAGAVERTVYGKIGIHRPYSAYVGKRDYQSTQKEYRKIETSVRDYLNEMNFPAELFYAMMAVPADEVHILTWEENEAFGLRGTDRVEQEMEDATNAARYGVSRREYLARKARAEQTCPQIGANASTSEMVESAKCYHAAMYGISRTTYNARSKRAHAACSSLRAESEERYSCVRAVLRGEK